MFCKKCGNQLTDGDAFCPKCGTEIVQQNQPVQSQESQPVQNQESQSVQNQPMQNQPVQNQESQPGDNMQQGVQSFAQVTRDAQNMQNQNAQNMQGAQSPQNMQGAQNSQYVSQPYPAANEPKPVKQPKVPKKPKKIGLIVVLMIVVAVGIAGLVTGLILLNRDGKKPEESKPAVQEESTQVGDLGYEENAFSKTPLNLTALNNLTPGTDEQVNARNAEIATIQAAVDGVKNPAGEAYTTVTVSNLSEYINAVSKSLDELSKSGTKVSYTKNADNIRVSLANGGYYMIIPNVEGTDEGDKSDDIRIATYQPCLSGYSSSISGYMSYIDDGAALIDKEFDKYTFKKDGSSTDDDYNDSEVDLNACASVSQYYVLLWHGHGGYDSSVGSYLLTGAKRSSESDKKLSSAISNNEILVTKDSYLITAAFIDKYVASDSLENTVVYLGACQSGRDSKLANAFLNKGAVAVYANSNTIHTTYNLSMIKSVCEGLTKKNSTGAYNSVSEALTYAKGINGNYDTGELKSTEVKLFTKKDENKNFTLDWYQDHKKTEREVALVLDVSGSMSGTPITETKNASVKFVETVLEASAKVGLVTYATNVTVASDFSLNKTALESKINSLSASGSTYTEGGLAKAADMLATSSSSEDKVIVLMSDGLPNRGKDGDDLVQYAQTLKDKGYIIYTVGFFSSLSGSDKTEAQSLMSRIATEGCHYEVSNAGDLTDFFDDIAAQINGQKYMYIKVQGPTNVTVTSGGETLSSSTNSSRTSFGSITYQASTGSSSSSSGSSSSGSSSSGSSSSGFGGSGFGSSGSTGLGGSGSTGLGGSGSSGSSGNSNETKIIRLKEGTEYNINIQGTQAGTVQYSISIMNEEGEYVDTRVFKNIVVKAGSMIDTVAKNYGKIILRVDENGDGHYENEYVAGENEEGKLVDKTLQKVMFVAIICLGVVEVILLLILIIKLNKRKKYKEYIKSGMAAA